MKREHKIEQNYIDWLKSLGCVVYLPLSEGDLQDKISGIELIQDTGSFAWNQTKQMYQFNTPYYNGSAAVLRNGFDKTMFTTNSYTFCIHFKKLSNLGVCRSSVYNISTLTADFNIGYNGGSNMTSMPSDYFYAHTMTSSSIFTAYQQGVYYNQWNLVNNPSYSIPSNWVINQNDKGLWLGCYLGYQSSVGSYCMGEIYIFDGVLDLSTIKRIQGIE